jgi:hypothetical protein
MSFRNSLRTALETQLATVVGIPSTSNRSWENFPSSPTTGTTWVRMTLLPSSIRPASMGDNYQNRHQGLFQVDIFANVDQGAAAAETLADAIRAKYTNDTVLTSGGVNVRFEYVDILPSRLDTPFYQVPVQIAWYSYET